MAWRAALVVMLAGCTSLGGDAVTGEVEDTTLRLALAEGGREMEIGQDSTWTFALENVGNQSVELARGCGQEWDGPWVEDDAGKRIQHEPLYATCNGFGYEHLEPDQEWTTQLQWNGSIYKGEKHIGEVEPGIYHLRLRAPWDDPLDLAVAIRAV